MSSAMVLDVLAKRIDNTLQCRNQPALQVHHHGDVLHWTGLLPVVAAASGAGGLAASERIPAVVPKGMGHTHVVQDAVPTCLGNQYRSKHTPGSRSNSWHVHRSDVR